jgi:tetratricopeptide (TPR) repeat protein
MAEDGSEVLVREADGEMVKGQFRHATLLYQSAIGKNPSSTSARIGLASALLSLGQLEDGRVALGSIDPGSIADPSDRSRYYFWMADWQAKRGEADSALMTIDEALPNAPPAMTARLQVLAARTLLQKGDNIAARDRTRAAGELLPSLDTHDALWLANVSLLCGDPFTGAKASRLVLSRRASLGAVYLGIFSAFAGLGVPAKLVAAVLVIALLLSPPAGWWVILAIIGALTIGVIVGWRRRLGGVLLSSLVYGGALLVGTLLVWLWMMAREARLLTT